MIKTSIQNLKISNVQGEYFLRIDKRADPNKPVQEGFFYSKLINVPAFLEILLF